MNLKKSRWIILGIFIVWLALLNFRQAIAFDCNGCNNNCHDGCSYWRGCWCGAPIGCGGTQSGTVQCDDSCSSNCNDWYGCWCSCCGGTASGTVNCGGGCDCPTCCVSNYGNSCNCNDCGDCGGTINCDGYCTGSTPANPAGYGNSCNCNDCGDCGGTINCGGSCSGSTPSNPSGYGNSCNCNACGCGGTTRCDGSCSGAAPPCCVPNCAGKNCGASDGCGGSCGSACDAGCPDVTACGKCGNNADPCTGRSCGQTYTCGPLKESGICGPFDSCPTATTCGDNGNGCDGICKLKGDCNTNSDNCGGTYDCSTATCTGGTKCNSPTAATCLDSNGVPASSGPKLRVYSSAGTCSGGACSYPYTDSVCGYDCSNGACNTGTSVTLPYGSTWIDYESGAYSKLTFGQYLSLQTIVNNNCDTVSDSTRLAGGTITPCTYEGRIVRIGVDDIGDVHIGPVSPGGSHAGNPSGNCQCNCNDAGAAPGCAGFYSGSGTFDPREYDTASWSVANYCRGSQQRRELSVEVSYYYGSVSGYTWEKTDQSGNIVHRCTQNCPAAQIGTDAGYTGCQPSQPGNSDAQSSYCASGACYKCRTGYIWDGSTCTACESYCKNSFGSCTSSTTCAGQLCSCNLQAYYCRAPYGWVLPGDSAIVCPKNNAYCDTVQCGGSTFTCLSGGAYQATSCTNRCETGTGVCCGTEYTTDKNDVCCTSSTTPSTPTTPCDSGLWCTEVNKCCREGFFWDGTKCRDYDPCSPSINPPSNIGTNTNRCASTEVCCPSIKQTGTGPREPDCVSKDSYIIPY